MSYKKGITILRIKNSIIAFLIIILISLNSGCIQTSREYELQDPDEVISEYFNHLLVGNYSLAISMMIGHNGQRISDSAYIQTLESKIESNYNRLFSGFIKEIDIDLKNKSRYHDEDDDYSTIIYNISYVLNWDGERRNFTISVIEMDDSSENGIYYIDEEDILKKTMFVPLPPSEGDLSLGISMERDSYAVTPPSLIVRITLTNTNYHPVLVPGESKAYRYNLRNENGTQFAYPFDVHGCDADVPPRRLMVGKGEITFDKDIGEIDWRYFKWVTYKPEYSQINLTQINYTAPFDFDVPGIYLFNVSHICYDIPVNVISSEKQMPWSNSNTIKFALVDSKQDINQSYM